MNEWIFYNASHLKLDIQKYGDQCMNGKFSLSIYTKKSKKKKSLI